MLDLQIFKEDGTATVHCTDPCMLFLHVVRVSFKEYVPWNARCRNRTADCSYFVSSMEVAEGIVLQMVAVWRPLAK